MIYFQHCIMIKRYQEFKNIYSNQFFVKSEEFFFLKTHRKPYNLNVKIT